MNVKYVEFVFYVNFNLNSKVMKEVNSIGLHRQSDIYTCSRNLGIVKIPHKQKSIAKNIFGRKMGPLANGALCLSTPKYDGKSGTASRRRSLNTNKK